MKRFALITVITLLVLGIYSNSGQFLYHYKVGVYGDYGVMIHQLGARNYIERFGKKSKRNPGIPGVRDDHPSNGQWDNGLPKGQQEIVWQLAEVNGCRYIFTGESSDKRFPGNYTRKAVNCKWNPLPTIYRQTIDFDQIHQSPEYQAATKFRWNVLDNSKYGVQILFAFKDSEVTMHLNYFKTNPWK